MAAYFVADYFLAENSKTMAEAFRLSLTRSPSPLVPTSSNSAACFLRNQLPPKSHWIFLKCWFLSELIRQQPACKDNTGYRGFLGLSLFGFFSKYLTHTENCLETLGLVGVPPLPPSLCLWFQNAFRVILERKKKSANGVGELAVFTEGSGEGGQPRLDATSSCGPCSFDGSSWKIFPPTRV